MAKLLNCYNEKEIFTIMRKNTNQQQETPSINLIGVGTNIQGDINTNGDIRIDGSVIGKITSKGKIVVGTSGNVEGEVFAKNADISGKTKGKINISEILTIKASADLTGDITTNRLAIEPGALFTGNCNMTKTLQTGNNIIIDEQEI